MTILDTNVISELMKAIPAPAVRAWMSFQPPDDLFISTVSMAEILYGIELLPKGKRRDDLLDEAEVTFAKDFSGRILTFDERAARMFGSIVAARRRQGRPIGIADGQIAAIARGHGATLATRYGRFRRLRSAVDRSVAGFVTSAKAPLLAQRAREKWGTRRRVPQRAGVIPRVLLGRSS